MNRLRLLLGVLLVLAGVVWFFQGIGVLPGDLMSGQVQWAVYGGLAVLAGAGLIFVTVRRRGG